MCMLLFTLDQWFLTFLKLGNTFNYTKNLRNTKINDSKNKQKHQTNKNKQKNKHILENILLNIFKFYILKYIIKIDKNLPFLIYFKIYSLYI